MNRPAITPRVSFAGALAFVALLAVSAIATGCGNESYPNKPRPPVTLTVSVFVGEDQIAYSPRPFGAGPVRFVTTNQTGVTQKVTYSTDRDERYLTIAPHQTAMREMVLEPGYLSIDADKSAADSLEITVGETRPSAQHELDQP
ncbi:MAG: hypothetical protein HY827_01590 [Actinobacteria bacterium]|nr:hypothetical protein [Actinomycetota bacterium]